MDARSKTFEPVSSQPRTTHWFIVLLFVMMTCSYIDRAVLNILVQPIKEEMRLTDLQIGLVGGLGFAILFIAAGVPVRPAGGEVEPGDHHHRRRRALVGWRRRCAGSLSPIGSCS